jgi:hypothetical protein
MRASVVAVSGILVSLFGIMIVLCGVGGLIGDAHPGGCAVAIVLGILLYLDGNKQYTRTYPREKLRERVAALRDPTGLSLARVRSALGRESEFRRTGEGAEVIWRVGNVYIALAFDAGLFCTGIVAARGITSGGV